MPAIAGPEIERLIQLLARLPLGSQLVRDARKIPLTVVVSRAAPRTATDALATHGAGRKGGALQIGSRGGARGTGCQR